MNVVETGIYGAYLIELDVFGDQRGFFLESYQRRRYMDSGINAEFVQDNRSFSGGRVLRGLHYQVEHPIGQLIYVTRGEVFDVGLDLRRDSPTFGHHVSYTLSEDLPRQLYLPPGVAHGFCTLAEENEILYKCSEYYYPDDEAGVLWSDPDIGIKWPIESPVINARDAGYPCMKDVDESMFPRI